MRKLVFSTGAIAFAFLTVFSWSQGAPTFYKESSATPINPTDMTMSYKGSLPVEQWDAV